MENENQKDLENGKEIQTENIKGGNKTNTEFYAQLAIIGILLIVVVYTAGQVYGPGGISGAAIGIGTVSASEIIPTGIPAVYGKEIGVNFDEVSPNNPQTADANIAKLSSFDKSITLTGDDLTRYIKILNEISCEFCCGAKSVIREDGTPACGCAHSYAMRGLAKYLITKHGSEYTDDEILEEVGKWKVLFFPGIHETKAAVLKEQGVELNYINLASNKYRGVEKGQQSSGGMVGGC